MHHNSQQNTWGFQINPILLVTKPLIGPYLHYSCWAFFFAFKIFKKYFFTDFQYLFSTTLFSEFFKSQYLTYKIYVDFIYLTIVNSRYTAKYSTFGRKILLKIIFLTKFCSLVLKNHTKYTLKNVSIFHPDNNVNIFYLYQESFRFLIFYFHPGKCSNTIFNFDPV